MARVTYPVGEITEKPCSSCKVIKPVSEFYTTFKANGKEYYRGLCKKCGNAIRCWQLRNAARLKEKNKGYYKTIPPNIRKKYNVARRFTMTVEQYDELKESQNSCCLVCGAHESERRLFVDHNHTTGVVRGFLCDRCNAGIGMLGEDPKVMIAALEYLESGRDTGYFAFRKN